MSSSETFEKVERVSSQVNTCRASRIPLFAMMPGWLVQRLRTVGTRKVWFYVFQYTWRLLYKQSPKASRNT